MKAAVGRSLSRTSVGNSAHELQGVRQKARAKDHNSATAGIVVERTFKEIALKVKEREVSGAWRSSGAGQLKMEAPQ